MKKAIIKYLAINDTGQFIQINEILSKVKGNKTLFEIREELQQMKDEDLIKIDGPFEILGKIGEGQLYDINTILLKGKITEKGVEEYSEIQKKFHEREIKRRQYEDYPRLRLEARWAIIIAVLSLLASIVLGVIQATKK